MEQNLTDNVGNGTENEVKDEDKLPITTHLQIHECRYKPSFTFLECEVNVGSQF